MSEETNTTQSAGGEVAEDSVSSENIGTASTDEGGTRAVGEGRTGADSIEYTRKFKERVDRIRAREKAIADENQRKRDAEWQKKFDDLNAKYESLKPKGIKREDFANDEDFVAAKRKEAANALKAEWEAEWKAKADKEAEDKRKADESTAYQQKFANKFNQRMGETMSEAMQQEVAGIVNDPYNDINTALASSRGETLKKWLMDDCENPAAVVLYLERNPQKLDAVLNLSARKQVQNLDGLEMALERARLDSLKKNATAQGGQKKAPVIGTFGGSSVSTADESTMSDQERVAKLIKAMRTR